MKKGEVFRNENGFIKFFFVMLVLAFLVYSGIKFGIPYYKYSAFKTDAKEIARTSVGDIEKTRAQVFDRAQELKIPITEESIEVTKTEKRVRVITSWSETVDMLGLYQKTLNFNVDVEE